MTTIATDGKSMAGDGQVTNGSLIDSYSFRKVFRLADGRIVGCAGDVWATMAIVGWLEKGGEFPKIECDGFEALVIDGTGLAICYNNLGQSAPQSLPAVIGSGSKLALGAMLSGANPTDAVDIACGRDCYSGGQIITEWIG